jgi:hypothetical protein
VLVGVVDGPRHTGQQLGRLPGRQRRRQARQALALDQLHAEVVLPLVLADFVNRHDVGMVEVGRGLGLPAEALHVLRGGELAG